MCYLILKFYFQPLEYLSLGKKSSYGVIIFYFDKLLSLTEQRQEGSNFATLKLRKNIPTYHSDNVLASFCLVKVFIIKGIRKTIWETFTHFSIFKSLYATQQLEEYFLREILHNKLFTIDLLKEGHNTTGKYLLKKIKSSLQITNLVYLVINLK